MSKKIFPCHQFCCLNVAFEFTSDRASDLTTCQKAHLQQVKGEKKKASMDEDGTNKETKIDGNRLHHFNTWFIHWLTTL